VVLDAPREYEAEHLLAAQRYGALPMVRAFGLARDLVVDLSNTIESGNGFLVHDDSPREVLAVLRRACATLLSGQAVQDAIGRIMSVNSSWEDRARKLEQAYTELMTEAES
jgi:starch synthase